MADAFLTSVRATLPPEAGQLLFSHIIDIKNGNYYALLSRDLVKQLVGLKDDATTEPISFESHQDWNDFVFRRLNVLIGTKYLDFPPETSRIYKQHLFFLAAIAALQAFVQTNITGPLLNYSSAELLLALSIARDSKTLKALRERLIASLSVDGIAAYRLVSCPELLCLADTILAAPAIRKNVKSAPWAKLRIDMLHQRLLSEKSPTLEDQIFASLQQTHEMINSNLHDGHETSAMAELYLEQASINLYHGFDKKAREDLDKANRITGLRYALTGQLGKRTKYQEKETSQLVVLAKSRSANDDEEGSLEEIRASPIDDTDLPQVANGSAEPRTIDLNDDTLLESISFNSKSYLPGRPGVVEGSRLDPELLSIDPNDQSRLAPLDSIVLLHLASSITSSSPVDGITREETLPYALRVLEGGSSNWQVYTQALLIRSRIEGYKSRTAERGLLQLQALVDQVVADTSAEPNGDTAASRATFLPRSQSSDSAPASVRLRYVHLLCAPTRWELETELASRWASMGGLRSALEIYERLEMWPEAALCWAATDREDKAKRIIKRLLNHPNRGPDQDAIDDDDDDKEVWHGPPRTPPPDDAPRLYCILGDLDRDPAMWQKAWEVSNGRYARAQRSLGRYYMAQSAADQAAEAYAKSLKVNQLNASTWFAYGCCLLELSRFQEAVEAFARTVQLDDDDAEAWSNLAAALVKRGPKTASSSSDDNGAAAAQLDDDTPSARQVDPQQHLRDALRSFKRAATLKQDSARIYDNVLTVAASLDPPAFSDIVAAQRRIIELRAKVEGESCVDEGIVDALVRHVVSTYPSPSAAALDDSTQEINPDISLETTHRPGTVPALVTSLMTRHVAPLITRSSRLWVSYAILSLWRNRPASALEAHEKAWRIITTQDKWEAGDEKQWDEVVQATLDLVDAYESLGPRERTEGLSAGSGEVVAKDWRFKARSAMRGVMGRGKELWEGSEGWAGLEERMTDLKGQG